MNPIEVTKEMWRVLRPQLRNVKLSVTYAPTSYAENTLPEFHPDKIVESLEWELHLREDGNTTDHLITVLNYVESLGLNNYADTIGEIAWGVPTYVVRAWPQWGSVEDED
jgi:hypothetical protein